MKPPPTSRVVEYTIGPTGGDRPITTHGSVAELLLAVPYLLVSGIIPPADIVNEVLRSGGRDAGLSGGCHWRGFEISVHEYEEILDALTGHAARRLRYEEPPSWVTSLEEWQIWVMEVEYGIPAEENLRFTREIADLERRQATAAAEGDDLSANRLLVEISEAAARHSEFLARHRVPPPTP